MIPRYSRPEMVAIWEPENRFQKWLQIEILACEASCRLGQVPPSSLATIKKKARFDMKRIEAIEKEVKHDVIAFLTSVAEHVGPDARYLHVGMTSSDVLDTAFSWQLREAADILIQDVKKCLMAIKKKAYQFKKTPMVGRSHGIHAEPISFGLKMASWYAEMKRNLERLKRARAIINVGMISGAVGNYGNIDPRVEKYVCRRLKMTPAVASTQVIARDHYAEFFQTLALIASSIERFAVEIRHLQRSEVLEAEEFFSKGQKGSSAMPHKRNPILSENLTGLARLVRSYSIAALENVPLWHERDISHSSVERVIGPDATVTLDFMLKRLAGLVEKLLVYPQNMQKNISQYGDLIFSEGVLLALVRSGLTREEAYSLVQRNAMKVLEEGADFKESLMKDADVTRKIAPEEIKRLFNIKHHMAHIDAIFRQVFS
ncbi:MAG: adenylosuccinate lyase [Deltaproteobacteria bacterium GWA2_50_8]|nr:MAG: adenylosuccinate lyase [Deltaproteobacteria bacterium GWA2_50_8]